jgi:outer membrane lipoprotein SlyB
MKTALLTAAVMAIGLSGCTTGSNYQRGYGSPNQYASNYSSRCNTCGVVERIDLASRGSASNSGAGAIAGAIIGGVLGNQVGSGDGRKVATVAGAVAGGVAGSRIESNTRDREVFHVQVRMDDGRLVVVEQGNLSGIREGSRVQISGGSVRLI